MIIIRLWAYLFGNEFPHLSSLFFLLKSSVFVCLFILLEYFQQLSHSYIF